jgi:flavin reductase (DIM6/NTAB) family NADH-FMN oxidoreductase RutF
MIRMQDNNDFELAEKTAPVFGLLDRELWLVTSGDAERRGGLISSFVSKASIVPELPRMSIGLAKQHHTCRLVQEFGRFALHLLWMDQRELALRFGLNSGRHKDKFAGLKSEFSQLGNPLIPDALAWLDCRVEASLDIGDRIVFIGEVKDGGVRGKGQAMSVNRLYLEASETQREQLGDMYSADAHKDAEAIRAWRENSGLAKPAQTR